MRKLRFYDDRTTANYAKPAKELIGCFPNADQVRYDDIYWHHDIGTHGSKKLGTRDCMKYHSFLLRTVFKQVLAILVIAAATTSAHGQGFQEKDRVAIVGGAFADLMHLHGYFETLLRHRCADKNIMVRNFGWAGDTLSDRARPDGFASEDQWLSDYKTDVIIICFGMGESFAGDRGLEEFERELKTLAQHYRTQKYNGALAPRLILVSPTAHEDAGFNLVDVQQRNKDLKNYTDAMRRIADEMNIPFVDLFSPSKSLMDQADGSRLTNNGIQLNAYGYWAISLILADKIAPGASPFRLVFDASGNPPDAIGGVIHQIRQTENGLTWNVETNDWPTLAPPSGSTVHASLRRFQDQVVIKSLPAGKHRLGVSSGQPITATAQQWAAGVVIDSTPRHQQLESYRKSVNEKNLKYFHGWRALNQVHIVGQRKKSPSGRALPAELVEWFRIATEQDERLSNISDPSKNERWTFEPIAKSKKKK